MPRKSKPNLNKLLKKWQPRLHLSHWVITVRYGTPAEMDGAAGLCFYRTNHLMADILIADPAAQLAADASLHPIDLNVELTLVHELLHPVFAQVFDRVKPHPTLDDLKEQVVDGIARSLMGL